MHVKKYRLKGGFLWHPVKKMRGFDFLLMLAVGGGVIGVILVVFGILRYVLHVL
jgi:hypothetical protein